MTLYLDEKRQTARGFQGIQSAWRQAKPTFGNLRPDQIDRDLCRSYIAKRRKAGVSDGTIIKELSVVRAAVKWSGNGSRATFSLPSAPPPRDRYLTKAEIDRLIMAAQPAHIKLFILIAWSTAARASAILDLTWDRVDFERGIIRLADGRSGGKGRATVPMTDRLRTALLAAQNARGTDWVIEWGAKRVKSVKRAFAESAKRAGLEDVSPHVIRHSAAVAMAEAGNSMAEIAQVLGHTNPAVTFKTYARYSPDYLRRAVKALE